MEELCKNCKHCPDDIIGFVCLKNGGDNGFEVAEDDKCEDFKRYDE